MKKIEYLIFSLLAFSMIFAACDSDSVSSPSPTDDDDQNQDGDMVMDGDLPDGDMTESAEDAETDGDAGQSDGDIEPDEDSNSDHDLEEDTENIQNACGSAAPLHCGDRLSRDTSGQPDEWNAYSCSARLESGNESIYRIRSDEDCKIEITLTNLDTDLDLFLLRSCDPFDCETFSSTPMDVQDDETILFDAESGETYFLTVDGYADAVGSYTLKVDCDCGSIDGDFDGDGDGEEADKDREQGEGDRDFDGCRSNRHCDPSEYCHKETGDCDGEGECNERPVACPEIWAPVCGCDGQTYGNACEAASTGVNIASEGECIVSNSCENNSDCIDGLYCDKENGDCDGVGVCKERPVVCLDVYFPVCGCDGESYTNTCMAAYNGRNIRSDGICPTHTCNQNTDCIDGYFCRKAVGDCDGEGECEEIPILCPEVYSPVCGCNGTLYSNECYAAAEGVSVHSAGTCGRK